jgi:DNA-binding NtrC family response regulator
LQKNVQSFSQSAVDALLAYRWPGNVRQLHSMIRRAVLLADEVITVQHLAMEGASNRQDVPLAAGSPASPDTPQPGLPLKELLHRKIIVIERDILTQVLRSTGGNKAKAARLLHIDYKTIHTKVREYGISID